MARPKGSKNKPKTNPNAPGAAGANAGPGHNSGAGKPDHNLTPDQTRQLFLDHRKLWNAHRAKQRVLDEALIELKGNLKNDGFTVKEMQIADALGELRGEARIQDDVKTRLRVARWIGHPLGAQMDLFEQPNRTPSTDRAYDQGKMASMENRPASPDYAPETEQYRAYMGGYHDHQRQIAGGLKAPNHAHESTLASREPDAAQPDAAAAEGTQTTH